MLTTDYCKQVAYAYYFIDAFNPLTCSGIRWLHIKLFGAIQV